MSGAIKLIIGFLKLNPIALAAIAMGFFSLGIYLQAEENKSNLMKADALLAGPPAPVAVSQIKAAAAAHPFGEVMVQAQYDLTMNYELVLEGSDDARIGYMVPLVAVDTGDQQPAEVMAILLYDDPALTSEAVTDLMLDIAPDAEGPFGPILMLNGMVGSAGDFDKAIEEVFALNERVLPAEVPVLRDFDGDRASAYNPDWPFEATIFGIFAWIGGAIGLFALFRSAVHLSARRSEGQEADMDAGLDAADVGAAPA